MPQVAPAPMPAASSAPSGASTLASPTATMTRPAPLTSTRPTRSATAAGVAVFVLDPATAATVNAAVGPWPADDPGRAARAQTSDPLPPAPRPVAPPLDRRGIQGRIADAFEASPFDGRMIVLGVAVGLSIGILVTLVLLAVE